MTRVLLVLMLVIGACTPTVEPSPASASVAFASPTRSPSPLAPTPTPITTPPVNPTANPFPSNPFFPIPSAIGADRAAGTVVFNDRAGSWRYDGSSGGLAVLSAANVQPVDRHIVATQTVAVGISGLFDARVSRYLQLPIGHTALFGSQSVSADGMLLAYVTPEKGLRIAFQQQLGNVDWRALAPDRLFSGTLIAPGGRTIAATGPSFAEVDPAAARRSGAAPVARATSGSSTSRAAAPLARSTAARIPAPSGFGQADTRSNCCRGRRTSVTSWCASRPSRRAWISMAPRSSPSTWRPAR